MKNVFGIRRDEIYQLYHGYINSCFIFFHNGSTRVIFQSALLIPTVSTSAFHSTNLFSFSRHHAPINRVTHNSSDRSVFLFRVSIISFSTLFMNPFQCHSCLKSFDEMKILEKKISDKHCHGTDEDFISLFRFGITLLMVFHEFKTMLKAGMLEGEVQDRPGKPKRLIYYCPFDFVVGTYPVRGRGRRFKHHETRLVKVVCATSKCRNRFCQVGLVPRVAISMYPYEDRNQRPSLTRKLLAYKSKVLA